VSENKVLLFPQNVKSHLDDAIECHERLGGLLRYYRPERFVAAGKGGMSTRFGGVGAWLARSNSVVFLRSRDRGSDAAVVFPRIDGDGYFDYTSDSLFIKIFISRRRMR